MNLPILRPGAPNFLGNGSIPSSIEQGAIDAKIAGLAGTLTQPGRVTDTSPDPSSALGHIAAGVQAVKIRFDGDSRFAGGAAAMDDTTVGPREAFWLNLRAKRGGVRLLGESLSGRYIVNSGTPIPQQPLLGDWHMSATGGYTVAQIDAAATASESASGPADVVIFTGGENDAAASTSASAILALIQTYVQNRKAANANAIVILCTQMIDSPVLVGYAARNAILAAVNAGLPALAASFSGVFVYDNAASMSLGDVNSSGNHPNGGGFNKWGAGLAALVLSKIGGGGLPFPRPVQPRVARARWKSTTEATDTAVVLDDGTKGILPQQGASFAFGKFFRPSTAPQSYQRILMCLGNGTGLAGNVVLLEGPPYAGCAHSSLQLYVDGVSRFQQNDALVQGRSCMIGVNVDRVRGEASIYCLREGDDGKPCTVLVSQVSGVVNWTYTFGKLVAAGTLPGLNGSPGLHGDVWVKPNGLVTVDEMEAAYFEDGIPVGAVSYPLADGSGTAIAPGLSFASYPSGTLTGGSWSAAGAIREPWHRAAHGSIVTGAVSSFADSAAKAWAQSVMAALAASGIAIDTTT